MYMSMFFSNCIPTWNIWFEIYVLDDYGWCLPLLSSLSSHSWPYDWRIFFPQWGLRWLLSRGMTKYFHTVSESESNFVVTYHDRFSCIFWIHGYLSVDNDVMKISIDKDIHALRDDLMELKPTLFAGVPRVFERVHEGTQPFSSVQLSIYSFDLHVSKSYGFGFQVCWKHYQNSDHLEGWSSMPYTNSKLEHIFQFFIRICYIQCIVHFLFH